MGSCLIVGNIRSEHYINSAFKFLSSLGSVQNEKDLTWKDCPDEIAYIDCLNLASIELFLDNIMKLEDLTSINDAPNNTKYKHLPWWMECVWLPVEFELPKNPVFKKDKYPVFIGSSYGLKGDLEDVQKALPNLNLGAKPESYEFMMRDPQAFYKSDFELNSEPEVIRWIWRALYDGANISIRENAPLMGVE